MAEKELVIKSEEGGDNNLTAEKDFVFDLQLFAGLAPEAFSVSAAEDEMFTSGDGTGEWSDASSTTDSDYDESDMVDTTFDSATTVVDSDGNVTEANILTNSDSGDAEVVVKVAASDAYDSDESEFATALTDAGIDTSEVLVINDYRQGSDTGDETPTDVDPDTGEALIGFNFNTASAEERGIGKYTALDLSNTKGKFNIIGSAHNLKLIKGSEYGGVLTAREPGSDETEGSTLIGGANDDKLYGSSGIDTYVKSGGNDTIKNYNRKDKIRYLDGALSDLISQLQDIINSKGFRGMFSSGDGESDGDSTVDFDLDSDNNAVITFEDGSTMTFEDVDGTEIYFEDENGDLQQISWASEDLSDEESDQTSDEESDQTSDEESDQTSDEGSDEGSDEDSDEYSDETSDTSDAGDTTLPQHDYANSENDITAIEENLNLDTPDGILTYEGTDETRGGADNPLTESDVNALIKAKDSALSEAVEVNITGNTSKTVDFSKYDSMKEVHLFKGNQAIKFNNEGGNVAHVVGDGYTAENLDGEEVTTAEATGQKTITFGNGGDLAVVDSSKANVTITGGTGDDSIIVREAAPVVFDMSKGGEDKVLLASDEATENVTLKGYKSSLGGGIVTGALDTEQIVGAIREGEAITFGDAKVTIGGAKVTFADNASANGTTFNLFDEDGDKQAVGFTHKEGGTVNVSSSKDDYVLVGNYGEGKSGASTLLGGSGDDTLLGGSGDVLNADGGSNQIELNTDSQRDGATIVLSTGRTTISGVNAHLAAGEHFDEEQGDTIQTDLTKAKVTYEDGVIHVKGDKLRGEIVDVTQAEDGAYVTQMFQSGGRLVKAAIAAKDSETTINADVGANYFKGDKSAVDFSTFEGTVNVDLSEDWASTLDGAVAGFNGINQLQAGEYDATLKGSSANETLTAGVGNATLYGGGGKNVLVGSAENEDRDGRVSFFVLGAENGARNTIQGFTFEDDVADKSLADVLEVGLKDKNYVSNVYIKGEDVVVDVSNSAGTVTETAIVEGAVGKNMAVSDRMAQVNTTSLTYDGDADFFVATGSNAAITIDNDNVTDAQIWLGNQSNKTFIGDIRTIDASEFDGRAELAGNDLNNTIMGGAGRNSLWGGNLGDDLLTGGSGANMFFYTNGNGNDTIQGVKEGDVVYLSAVTLENISSTDFASDSITINFNDGGKLKINDAGSNVGIVIGEQTYYVNSARNDYTTTKP